MPTPFLHNNNVKVSMVEVEDKEYLVYVKTVGAIIPKLIEDVTTGKRISYKEIKHEIAEANIHNRLDQLVNVMIQKLNEK